MTEDYDFDSNIDVEFYNDWDDGMYDYDASLYDYLDCDEQYHTFSAGWDQDDPIYWIQLEIENDDYYYVKISYEKVERLEIGKKKQALLKLSDSPFDRDYFLIYDGERISPKSREQFIPKIEHLLKLKNFL